MVLWLTLFGLPSPMCVTTCCELWWGDESPSLILWLCLGSVIALAIGVRPWVVGVGVRSEEVGSSSTAVCLGPGSTPHGSALLTRASEPKVSAAALVIALVAHLGDLDITSFYQACLVAQNL